jgi:hypothetical protein
VVDLVDTDLNAMGQLRPALAGQTIAATLTIVVTAWFDVVPSIATELELLGRAVSFVGEDDGKGRGRQPRPGRPILDMSGSSR